MEPERNNKKDGTVLITRFSAVGDIAMTIPLLYPLAEAYPNTRFVLVSRKRFGQLLINKPDNLLFKGVDVDNYKGVVGLRRLFKELNDEFSPTVMADLHDVLRTKILRVFFALNCVKTEHIVKGRVQKRRLTSSRKRCREQLTPTFERYIDVFTRLGYTFVPDFISLFQTKADIKDFSDVLPKKGNDKWVGIAPFARHRGKIYPLSRMKKVVELLSSAGNIKVICFGNGSEEESVVNEWCQNYDNVISFIGRSNFEGELRLISNLDLMLCMDSANMHLASLVDTPAVTIWGATSPLAGFLGWRQNVEDCIQLQLDCRPCSIFGDKPCRLGDYRCMEIPPEEVADKILKRINL